MKRNKAEKLVIRLAKECQSNHVLEIYEYVYWEIFKMFEGKKTPPEYRDALVGLKHGLVYDSEIMTLKRAQMRANWRSRHEV
jgi:hypothetical protein